MKSFLITTFTFLVFTITSKAQWTTSGSSIVPLPANLGYNVGIGTTTPGDLLTINSGFSRKGLTFTSDGDGYAYSDEVFAVSTTSAIGIGKPILWDMSHRKDGYFSNTPVGESSFEFYAVLKGGGYTAPLCFKSNGDIILASPRSSASGNVAIGTTDPQGYKLAVNGNVIATSMTVKAYTNWPDYVFNTTYKLPSLSEVKTYINQNHHLPDVPSAAEVEKNGLNLGEMNKVLLKKVEELTLYLVEKDKTGQEQKEINKQQQQQIDELKQQLQLLLKKSDKN